MRCHCGVHTSAHGQLRSCSVEKNGIQLKPKIGIQGKQMPYIWNKTTEEPQLRMHLQIENYENFEALKSGA